MSNFTVGWFALVPIASAMMLLAGWVSVRPSPCSNRIVAYRFGKHTVSVMLAGVCLSVLLMGILMSHCDLMGITSSSSEAFRRFLAVMVIVASAAAYGLFQSAIFMGILRHRALQIRADFCMELQRQDGERRQAEAKRRAKAARQFRAWQSMNGRRSAAEQREYDYRCYRLGLRALRQMVDEYRATGKVSGTYEFGQSDFDVPNVDEACDYLPKAKSNRRPPWDKMHLLHVPGVGADGGFEFEAPTDDESTTEPGSAQRTDVTSENKWRKIFKFTDEEGHSFCAGDSQVEVLFVRVPAGWEDSSNPATLDTVEGPEEFTNSEPASAVISDVVATAQ